MQQYVRQGCAGDDRAHTVGMVDSAFIICPYCGERFEALVDASAGDAEYIEDCQVCCRPITVRLSTGENGDGLVLDATRDD